MATIPVIDRFEQLRDTNLERCARWHPGFPTDDEWTLADWSNAMGGEVGETSTVLLTLLARMVSASGEAQNLTKKLRRLQTGTHGNPLEQDWDALVVRLGEEVADVIIYADLLLAKLDLDMWACVVTKFNQKSEELGFPERLHL